MNDTTDPYKKGKAFMKQKQFGQALECFDRAIKLSPANIKDVYVKKGNSLFELKRYAEANDCYNKTILIDKNFALAYNNKANILVEMGKYAEALEYYDHALQLNPSYSIAFNNKGTVYEIQKDYIRAIEYYDKALNANCENWMAVFNKACCLSALGQFAEAILCFEAVSQIYGKQRVDKEESYRRAKLGKRVIDHVANGIQLFDEGDNEEATNCFDMAIKIDQDCYHAYSAKGLALCHLKRYEEAIECFNMTMQIYWYFCTFGLSKGQRNRIREQLDRIHFQHIKFHPPISTVHYYKGIALFELKEYEKALDCFDISLNINSRNHLAYNNKANCLFELGRFDEALECYDLAIKMKADYSIAYNNKAVVLVKSGKYRQAVICYEKALNINPDYEEAYKNQQKLLRGMQTTEI